MVRTVIAALVLAVAVAHGGGPSETWKTYRSDAFGWELSYPSDVELKVWFDGRSGELRDATTGDVLAEIEVWPGDLCPREKPGTTAKAIGIEHVVGVTQTDGDDGSSSCGVPMAVRRLTSDHGVPLYELELSCVRERIVGRRSVHRRDGHKGPTFFADVSQSWRKRVLTVDPRGVDTRMAPVKRPADLGTLRRILATVATFPVADPNVVCIDDLRPAALLGTSASPSAR